MVTSCFARFMFKEILLVPTECISAIFMDLRTNSDCLEFHNRNVGACSLAQYASELSEVGTPRCVLNTTNK
jgi:uncharacterized protein (UPF0261 family)